MRQAAAGRVETKLAVSVCAESQGRAQNLPLSVHRICQGHVRALSSRQKAACPGRQEFSHFSIGFAQLPLLSRCTTSSGAGVQLRVSRPWGTALLGVLLHSFCSMAFHTSFPRGAALSRCWRWCMIGSSLSWMGVLTS